MVLISALAKHLVNAGLLHIQDLSSDRQDGLVVPVSGCLGRTACRISLYDKNLTLFRHPGSHSSPAFHWSQRNTSAWSADSSWPFPLSFGSSQLSPHRTMTFFSISTFRSKYRPHLISGHLCRWLWPHPGCPAWSWSALQTGDPDA